MSTLRRCIFPWTVALLSIALAGCGTLNQAQFQIPDPSGSAADRERLVAVVKNAATDAGMVDRTASSKIPNTLVYFEEPVASFRTTLGARTAAGYLIIDLACFHFKACETPTFSFMTKSLADALQTEFGSNWRLVTDPANRIPVSRQSPAP
jgi:hypothetical protein